MGKRLGRWCAAAAMVISAVTACSSEPSGAPSLQTADATAKADHRFVIPRGTASRLRSGEKVEIMRSPLKVKVGQVLVVVNEDSEPQSLGPFYVGAGETVVQRFASPGELRGACALTESGVFVIEVRR